MKYSRPFTALFLFTLGAAGAAWAAGCAGGTDADLSGPKASSSSSSGSVGQGGEGGQGGSVGQGGQGGSMSGAGGSGGAGGTSPSCGPAGDLVLAVSSLYIGDKNFNDTKSNTAWKQFGFDIDGKISTGQSNDLCKPRNGALPTTVYPDGNNGIDNSFGKNILPILLVMDANFSDSVNMSITSGALTMLLRFEGLGSGPNMDPVSAKLYTGVNLGSPPELDGTDCWPVRLEDLVNPQDINSTKVVFPTSSLASNVWKSGVTATMLLPLSTSAGPLSLTLHQARLSFTLDPTHTGVMDGQLGGVLDTAEFLAVAKKALGAFDSTLCSGPTSDSILKQIESASDILKDGTQDPAATCDGISIGLGFKASWAGFDSIAPPEKPPVDPCAP